MRSRLNRIKILVAFVAFAASVAFLFGEKAGARSSDKLSDEEKRGKQIYLKGESSGGDILAYLGSTDLELPASSFSCSNCHGLRGEGLKEGGLQPPPIDWATLTSAGRSSLTGRERPAYTEATLARAISAGIGSDGRRLHPGMPHYKMTATQMSDLIAYLKKMGGESDMDRGVSEGVIKVGAALPMTGPLSTVGEDVKATLEAYFAEVNSQGGIYGRKFELVVEDSRGEQGGTLDATRRLVDGAGVFALVASFERGDSDAVGDYLRQSEVPLIGPVTLSPRPATVPNPFVFYLLPSFSDQARSLADYLAAEAVQAKRRAPSRIAVVYADTDFDRSAREGLLAQARLHGMEVVFEQSFKSAQLTPTALVKSLAAKKPDAIFFFGGPEGFAALAGEMDRMKLESRLFSSAVMVGRAAFDLPPAIAPRTHLAYPAALPGLDDFSEFLAVIEKAKVRLRNAAFQSAAFAAAKLLVEATKSSGRALSRRPLINSLEQFRDFKTGVAPPVTFGPNRRIGATGSYIVGVDLANNQYKPMSGRIAPKEIER